MSELPVRDHVLISQIATDLVLNRSLCLVTIQSDTFLDEVCEDWLQRKLISHEHVFCLEVCLGVLLPHSENRILVLLHRKMLLALRFVFQNRRALLARGRIGSVLCLTSPICGLQRVGLVFARFHEKSGLSGWHLHVTSVIIPGKLLFIGIPNPIVPVDLESTRHFDLLVIDRVFELSVHIHLQALLSVVACSNFAAAPSSSVFGSS